jgi:hypothetical protein
MTKARCASDEAVDLVLDRTQPQPERIRAAAAIRNRLCETCIARLVQSLETADEIEAYEIAQILVLGKTKDPDMSYIVSACNRATKPLLRVLRHAGNPYAALASVHTLQRTRDSRSARQLVHTAKAAESEDLRAKAYDALSAFARRTFVTEALIAGLVDKSPNIRYFCAVSLSSAARNSMVRSALSRLRNDEGTSWEGWRICDAVQNILDLAVTPRRRI